MAFPLKKILEEAGLRNAGNKIKESPLLNTVNTASQQTIHRVKWFGFSLIK